MKKLILLILLNTFIFSSVFAKNEVKRDSLVQALKTATDKEKALIYRNLADITYLTPEEAGYLQQTYLHAKKNGDRVLMFEALNDIIVIHCNNKQIDSSRYYLNEIKELETPKEGGRWSSFVIMYMFNIEIAYGSGEGALDDRLKALNEKTGEESIYTQIEKSYSLASALSYKGNYDEALTHINNAVNLAQTLSFEDNCHYQIATMRMQSKLLARAKKHLEAIAIIEKVIEMQERYNALYYKNTRPFYPMDEFYIMNYTTLMINARALTKEKSDFYISRLDVLRSRATRIADKYNCTLSMNNYYLSKDQWGKALETNDTLIKYANEIAPYNVSGLYALNSIIYEALNRPKDALKALRISYNIKDSIETLEAKEKLNELQVKYGIDKLDYEKTQLEIKNKRTFIVALFIVLALISILCLYLWYSLKREKMMKAKLKELKAKSEESEKMKSTFIKNICHEIRTPLNAISGFSQIMFEPELDEETKLIIPNEIMRNTQLLTSLIDCVLEVSRLDVSGEKLPCEKIDVALLCSHYIKIFKNREKEGIDLIADIPTQPLIFDTNEHYLSLVIDNLVTNAYKFTDKGSVTLKCSAENKIFKLTVTDTGKGIPKEMQDSVFERFSKLDEYKQGGGLGLYLSKVIITRLQGRIYIDPTYDNGTRVVLELPMV